MSARVQSKEHALHPLEKRRRNLGFSIAEVAELTGISQSVIRQIERGDKIRLRRETAMSLAKGLDTSLKKLFRDEDLSDEGRMPKTGTPIPRRKPRNVICKKCHVEIPRKHGNKCPDCGQVTK